MTAVYRSGTTAVGINSFTLAAPAGIVSGDLLILCGHSNATLLGITASNAGQSWTLRATHPASLTSVWTAIYNGTWTGLFVDTGGSAVGTVVAYQKDTFDPTTPIDTNITTATPANSTSMSIGTIVTTIDGALLVVWAGGANDNNAGASPFTGVTTGWTTRQTPGTNLGTDSGGILAELAQATAGTSAAANVTQAAAYAQARPILFAIRPLVRSASIAGAMTGIDGTVQAAASSGASTSAQIIGTMSGLDGGATVRAFREDFVRPRREFVWVYNYEGEQVHVLS